MANQARVRIEACPKRIRNYLGGEVVADTTEALLVWESPYYPQYYVPRKDVRLEMLVDSERTEHSASRGDARFVSLTAGNRTVADGAWEYPDSPIVELRGHLRFDWEALDHWFEEDEEVWVHARDPYKRVDVLHSSRHVQVIVDGVTVADSVRPTLLFETSLPSRYYLPLTDVRLDLLEPTDTTTRCPYKGTANYWSVRVGDTVHPDLVWCYRSPLAESVKIAGLACFYNEKVEIVVDGIGEVRMAPARA